MWRFEMQFSTLFQKERKDEARVCYKEALRWLLSLNQNYFSIVYSDFSDCGQPTLLQWTIWQQWLTTNQILRWNQDRMCLLNISNLLLHFWFDKPLLKYDASSHSLLKSFKPRFCSFVRSISTPATPLACSTWQIFTGICVHVYLCICIFEYLCICVPVYSRSWSPACSTEGKSNFEKWSLESRETI